MQDIKVELPRKPKSLTADALRAGIERYIAGIDPARRRREVGSVGALFAAFGSIVAYRSTDMRIAMMEAFALVEELLGPFKFHQLAALSGLFQSAAMAFYEVGFKHPPKPYVDGEHPLPDGTAVRDIEVSMRAWADMGEPIAKVLEMRLFGFGPHFDFARPDGSVFTMPFDVARAVHRVVRAGGPPHENDCPGPATSVPLVGCPACEHANGGPL